MTTHSWTLILWPGTMSRARRSQHEDVRVHLLLISEQPVLAETVIQTEIAHKWTEQNKGSAAIPTFNHETHCFFPVALAFYSSALCFIGYSRRPGFVSASDAVENSMHLKIENEDSGFSLLTVFFTISIRCFQANDFLVVSGCFLTIKLIYAICLWVGLSTQIFNYLFFTSRCPLVERRNKNKE